MSQTLKTVKLLDKHLKVVKAGDDASSLELGSQDNGARISGDLDINGNTKVSNGDVTIDSAKKIYLDGGGDTYIAETLADRLEINVGGEPLIVLREGGGGASDKVSIPALTPLYFDGGNDTYIHESAADVLDFIIGGFNMLELDEGNGINSLLGETRLVNKDGSTYSSTDVRSVQTKAQIDTAISAGGGGAIATTEVTVSEAEMNALHTTEKELVAAQGSGNVVIPISCMLFIDRDGSTAQANSVNLHGSWNGSTNLFATIFYIKRFMYNESGDRIINIPKVQNGQGEAAQGLADADDRPFTIKLDGAITSGSIDSMKVVTAYHVYDNS